MATGVVVPPHTYAEWVSVLDMLKNKVDDELVLSTMYRGTIEWQSGVAERFSRKLIDTINFRMNDAIDRFQREMGRAHGEERAIVQSIYTLRRELSFLAKAINLPVIPESDRKQYYQLVISQANSIQSSLEDSAKKERSGKLASIIRNNKVNSF